MNWQGPQPPSGQPSQPPLPTNPSSPPPMPIAGWYVDPQQATNWRYWDGARWTDDVSPMHPRPRARVPHSFGAWFEESTDAVKATVRRVGIAVLVVTLVVHAAFVVLFVSAFNSEDGRSLRRILDLDDRIGGTGTIELSDAEWDRVGDLLRDLARGWLPALVMLVGIAVLLTLALVTLTARAAWDRTDDAHPKTASVVQPPSLLSASIHRLPVVVGSAIVLMLLAAAVVLVPLLPFVLALVADSGGSAIGITATLGFLASFVFGALVFGRLSLAIVIAAGGGHGLGIARSWRLTEGHYWGVVGRLLVAGLIASAFALPFNFLNGAAAAIGLAAWIIVVMVGQAVTSAASVLISTPAQVVLTTHLTEQHRSSEIDGRQRSDGSPFTPRD